MIAGRNSGRPSIMQGFDQNRAPHADMLTVPDDRPTAAGRGPFVVREPGAP
jgi:hypothetical protein